MFDEVPSDRKRAIATQPAERSTSLQARHTARQRRKAPRVSRSVRLHRKTTPAGHGSLIRRPREARRMTAEKKCRRWDSNPHVFWGHRILNPARLPVPPLRPLACSLESPRKTVRFVAGRGYSTPLIADVNLVRIRLRHDRIRSLFGFSLKSRVARCVSTFRGGFGSAAAGLLD